jgi:hypothetical protein
LRLCIASTGAPKQAGEVILCRRCRHPGRRL